MIQARVTIQMNSRDQGNRGSCVAFSLAGIKGVPSNLLLSPEYAYLATVHQSPAWKPNAGLDVRIAIAATGTGLPEDHHFPYQQNEPGQPLPPMPSGLSLHGPDLTLLATDLDKIKQWLGMGRPVGVLVSTTQSFMRPIDGVVAFEANVFPGRHAVVIVGYGHDQLGTEHYLICNSWGVSWGVNGHAWVPHSYLTTHASCIYGADK
ncbi:MULTISPECIES: C1 family peptidase [unclassified Pseudomonas]|uniref:C1 family peptidase n=1 Tax=unclassified Pseudomonas TaxID=196821 RepID=UPI000B682A78|nr:MULTISPECIES: C1 family peptidase [Pseudomonas]SNT51084.1 Cysteine protease [Pseudomonas sp. LAMO17WK12:I8]SNY43864.1 Cysteine protease [Pseudomonas sp. LAMO17WK12:I7]SNY43949.1 Cysteine protease [Pseudomonas sp. LAMO17WK12:I12]SNY44165.1 Cysteine protease [Pseudomonas sp. LAMO17WK12:I11]